MDAQTAVAVASYPIIAASLIVYVVQARQMLRQTTTLAASHNGLIYQHLAAQMASIDRLFVDLPHLRPFFYEGAPLPQAEPDRSQVVGVAEMFIDFVDSYVVVQRVACGPDGVVREALDLWIRYFRDLAATSPAIRDVWLSSRKWYAQAVRDVLDAPCGLDGAA